MARKRIVHTLLGGVSIIVASAMPVSGQDRVSATEKGSLLIFPKVEIRWDASGNVIQDTFIDLTNDYPADVQVQMYFVNGDSPLPTPLGARGPATAAGAENWRFKADGLSSRPRRHDLDGATVAPAASAVVKGSASGYQPGGDHLGLVNGTCGACGPGEHWIDDPRCASGVDDMLTGAVVGLDLNLNCLADTSLILGGPVVVNRSDPLDDSQQFPGLRPVDGHMDVIDTEIVSLSLTGGGVTLTAGAGQGIAPLAPSLGAIAEQAGDAAVADSFFKVFFEVHLGGGSFVYNQGPVPVADTITCVAPDANYLHPVGCTPLYTSPVPGEGVHVANLVAANHDTADPLPCHPACPGTGDCFTPGEYEMTGCEDEDCCCLICALDPFCCDVMWDGVCADLASQVCERFERDHPGWNWVDVGIGLTANEPTYWSALTGLPKGVSPLTVLDPGDPPGRPASDGSGDRVLRGTVLAWAVNANGQEIRWNHLKGDALIVNYLNGSAWEYNALAYQSHIGVNGDALPVPGELLMNGSEYDMNFGQLLLDFYAVGSTALSGGGRIVSVNTDLTLLPLGIDLRQETGGPVTTKANFDIWNMNEWHFSGTERCITCWDQELLSNYNAPNHFLLGNLQTDKGKARIDGLASQWCDYDFDPTDGPLGSHPEDVISSAAPLVALSMKVLTFGAGADFAMAGSNVVGMGTDQSAVIRADVISSPPPERPGIGFNNPPKPTTGVVR